MTRRIALLSLLAALAALIASCGSSGDVTPTTTATSAPSATPVGTNTPPSSSYVPNELTRIVFVDGTRGWALTNCDTEGRSLPCRIVSTEDGGRTWQAQYSAPEGEVLQDIQIFDGNHLVVISYLAREAEPLIVATDDGGATWNRRGPSGITEAGAVHFASPLEGFILRAGAIYRSGDGGATWALAYEDPDCSFRAIDFPTPDVGWATGGGPEGPCLYQTEDGGETWSLSFQGVTSPPVEEAFREYLVPGRGYTLEELRADAARGCPGRRLEFLSSSEGWLFLGSCLNGGFAVFRTTNAGLTWQYQWGNQTFCMGCQTTTGGMDPVFFLDLRYVWRQGGKTLDRSSDGGATWTAGQELGNWASALYGRVFFIDPTHGWLTSREGRIGFTDDGGATWDLEPVVISD